MSLICSILADMLREYAEKTNNENALQMTHEETKDTIRNTLEKYWQTTEKN